METQADATKAAAGGCEADDLEQTLQTWWDELTDDERAAIKDRVMVHLAGEPEVTDSTPVITEINGAFAKAPFLTLGLDFESKKAIPAATKVCWISC